jgi:hypothetical protein
MAYVSINDDPIDFWVRSSEVSISKDDNTVYAVFTCQRNYTDDSAILKFFNGDPASVTLKIEGPVDADAIRTITFVKAVCKTYSEVFEHQPKDSKNLSLWVTFSIEAQAVAMGEEDFPK